MAEHQPLPPFAENFQNHFPDLPAVSIHLTGWPGSTMPSATSTPTWAPLPLTHSWARYEGPVKKLFLPVLSLRESLDLGNFS